MSITVTCVTASGGRTGDDGALEDPWALDPAVELPRPHAEPSAARHAITRMRRAPDRDIQVIVSAGRSFSTAWSPERLTKYALASAWGSVGRGAALTTRFTSLSSK